MKREVLVSVLVGDFDEEVHFGSDCVVLKLRQYHLELRFGEVSLSLRIMQAKQLEGNESAQFEHSEDEGEEYLKGKSLRLHLRLLHAVDLYLHQALEFEVIYDEVVAVQIGVVRQVLENHRVTEAQGVVYEFSHEVLFGDDSVQVSLMKNRFALHSLLSEEMLLKHWEVEGLHIPLALFDPFLLLLILPSFVVHYLVIELHDLIKDCFSGISLLLRHLQILLLFVEIHNEVEEVFKGL